MDKDCRLSFVGKFTIDRDLICKEPDIVSLIFSAGIVLRAEADFYTDSIEYIMFAPQLFDELEEGTVVPHYDVMVAITPEGEKHVLAERIR